MSPIRKDIDKEWRRLVYKYPAPCDELIQDMFAYLLQADDIEDGFNPDYFTDQNRAWELRYMIYQFTHYRGWFTKGNTYYISNSFLDANKYGEKFVNCYNRVVKQIMENTGTEINVTFKKIGG